MKKEYLSPMFESILKEVTYNYDIDPNDRAWFIDTSGNIYGDVGHIFIMKKLFNKEWSDLITKGMKDSSIDVLFEKRLLNMGWTKIGELSDFYVITKNLSGIIKDRIQGFCKSLIKKVPEAENRLISIESDTEEIKASIGDISKDYLFNLG
jgi:hypothetical protein